MSSRYESRQEIANKADWEGGLLDLLFGYGLTVDECPEDDTELREAVAEVLKVGPAIRRLEALLPEPGEEDDELPLASPFLGSEP